MTLSIQLKSQSHELLRCLLSPAKAGVFYEKVFITSKSPAATRFIAPGQARPLPPHFSTRLMKQTEVLTNTQTDAVDQ